MFVYDSDVLIQSEDRSCEQERLRHIIQQPAYHIVDMDYLILLTMSNTAQAY